MVFQGYALFPHMSVEANIAFPLKVRGHARPTRSRRRVGAMVERVGLSGHEPQAAAPALRRPAAARRPGAGAGVRAGACCCSTSRSPPSTRPCARRCRPRSSACTRRRGTTFVFVTHDQSEALALSSRVAIFNHGEVLQVGTPQEVYERPAEPLRRRVPRPDQSPAADRHRRRRRTAARSALRGPMAVGVRGTQRSTARRRRWRSGPSTWRCRCSGPWTATP